jgi:transglutaminase-like putative cysteine protease
MAKTLPLIPLTLLAFILLCNSAYSQNSIEPDNNITISKKETYEFKQGDREHPVIVKQQYTVTYYCNQFRATVPFVESYDDRTSIDEVNIRVDGSRAKNIKPVYDYYSVDNIFYSDARVCYFNLPLEKKGSNSEVQLEKTYTDPRYLTNIYFPESYPVKEKEVVVIIPRWMKAELKEMNFGKTVSRQLQYDAKKDADIYTYTISNASARKKENNSPGPSYIYPHVLVLSKYATTGSGRITYFNTLDDQYAWYHSLVQQLQNDEALLKEKALDITKGINKDIDKIKTIYQWVQDNIRYIAFEDGIAGFRPEQAQEVLRKKYGDCKGMANLTKGLLKSIGFDSRLCWIGTNHIAYDYSTPSLCVDNHMICAVKFNNKLYYLDATETYIGFEQYAERIQGRQVLIENGNSYLLERIPVETYVQNIETEKRVLSIQGDSLTGQVYQNWKGESKEFLLSGIHATKKDKLSDALLQYLSDPSGHDQLDHVKTSDLSSTGNDLSIQYHLNIRNGATGFGNEWYIEMDHKKELATLIMDTVNRNADWVFPYKYDLQHETELSLPAGAKAAALPAPVKIDRPEYMFNIYYSQANNKILYKKELILKKSVLPRSAFAQWNRDIELLNKIYLEQLVISKK